MHERHKCPVDLPTPPAQVQYLSATADPCHVIFTFHVLVENPGGSIARVHG